MNFWEFRKYVRAHIDMVGHQLNNKCCPLGVLDTEIHPYNPDPLDAAEKLSLATSYETCCGIADGWDRSTEYLEYVGTPEYERGRRYGRRMDAVFGRAEAP